jgi:hypothetical protein
MLRFLVIFCDDRAENESTKWGVAVIIPDGAGAGLGCQLSQFSALFVLFPNFAFRLC